MRKAFTLIELLISTGILAVLLTIVIVAINIPKHLMATRDLQRKVDVKQLADALAAYYTQEKTLPPQDLWYSLVCGNSSIPQSLQPFMSSFPCDPVTSSQYYYETLDQDCQPCNDVVCQKFRVLTTLENANDQSIPAVGCSSQIGCGLYTKEGQPYNFGATFGCPLTSSGLAWQTSQTALLQQSIPQTGKILELQLTYDKTSSPKLKLTSLTKKNGYPNPPTDSDPEYKIVFQSTTGTTLYTTDFSATHQYLGFEILEDIGPVEKTNFALTLPWYDQIETVRIEDQTGNLIASASSTDIVILDNTPMFFTIPGSAVSPQTSSPLNFTIIPSVKAQSTNNQVNMVFIGDGFSQSSLTTYHENITKFIKELMSYAPFSSRASDINFHYIDSTQSFNCYGHPNFYYCLGPVTSAVNSAGVPWDNIYIVVNTTQRGGAAYYNNMAYGSISPEGPQIYVHELGHSFGLLADEYLAGNSLEKSDRNCYSGTPPNPSWTGLVAANSYFQGCNYSNWYRSSDNSIMKTLEAHYFNPISQKYLTYEIDRRLTIQSTPTPVPPQPTSNPPSPTPTPIALCNQTQTFTLSQSIISASPSATLSNNLIITNTDPSHCSSLFTISRSFPTGWIQAGIPASVTISGGQTTTVPFTITLPSNIQAGNHIYQFWVAKTGQSSVNPINGQVEITTPFSPDKLSCICKDSSTQIQCVNIRCYISAEMDAICNPLCSSHGGLQATSCFDDHYSCTGISPTPSPIPCTAGYSSSLSPTSLSGAAGSTVSQTLTLTNNNLPGCATMTIVFSHGEPSGFTLSGLTSTTLAPGETKNIPVTTYISTGAQVQNYQTQIWVNSTGNPYNTTINVTSTAPPPEQTMFSNLSAKLYGNYALFKFSYAASGTGSFRTDVATDPVALNQTVGPNNYARYGFAFGSGTPMDASNIATPTSIRANIQRTPESWYRWTCGTPIFWRMYNSGDLRIYSPIQTGIVDCITQITILPWEPWYAAIYQGVYDARYDADTNGVVNWVDYWLLVDQTKLR